MAFLMFDQRELLGFMIKPSYLEFARSGRKESNVAHSDRDRQESMKECRTGDRRYQENRATIIIIISRV